jgi:hypothetical protein
MASTQSSMKLFANQAIEMFDHDPGSTAATLCSADGGTTINYVDMRDCGKFAVAAMASTLTGSGITLLEIVACPDTAFTANVTQIKTSGTVAADAVGDYVVEECTAEEVNALGKASSLDLRYAAARLTCQNAADEAVVVYIQADLRFGYSGVTADTIA